MIWRPRKITPTSRIPSTASRGTTPRSGNRPVRRLFHARQDAVHLRDRKVHFPGDFNARDVSFVQGRDFPVAVPVFGVVVAETVFLAQLVDRLAGDAVFFSDGGVGFERFLETD